MLGVLMIASIFFLVSCGGGLSQEDADEIKSSIQSISSRVSEMEDKLTKLKEDDEKGIQEAAESTVDDVLEEISNISSRLAEIEERLEEAEPEELPQEGAPPAQPGQPAQPAVPPGK
jgi:DNA repair exonuclease SbcCD ATPase subunit